MRKLYGLLVLAGLLSLIPAHSFSTTIHVPDDQPTIQAGINAIATDNQHAIGDPISNGAGKGTTHDSELQSGLTAIADTTHICRIIDWSYITDILCDNADAPLVFPTNISMSAPCAPADSSGKRGGIHPDVAYFENGFGPKEMDSLVYNLVGDPYQSNGSGLDDLSSSGTYTGSGLDWTDTFYVKITSTAGAVDTFTWKKGAGGTFTDTHDIDTADSSFTFSNGVSVSWGATTGHTADDEWTIYCYDIALYAKSSTPNWPYWMVHSYNDSCSGLAIENNILHCSNDGETWVIPYFVCSTQISTPSTIDTIFSPGLFTRNGYDDLPGEAMVRWDSVPLLSPPAGFSDPDMVFDPVRDTMYVITRPFWSANDSCGIVAMSSANGVIWYPNGSSSNTSGLRWMYDTCGDTLKGCFGVLCPRKKKFLSPSFVIDTGGIFRMWYVEKVGNRYLPIVRTATNFYGPWSLPDTCDLITIDGDSARGIWHMNPIKHDGRYLDLPITKDSSGSSNYRLDLAYSLDGLTWYGIDTILVQTGIDGDFDEDWVYRASGIITDFGGERGLKLWYSANGNNMYNIGYTTAHFISSFPLTPLLMSPIKDTILDVFQPDLILDNSTDAESDPLVYDFEIYSDTLLESVTSGIGIEEQPDNTSWTVDEALEENGHYFWRARAFDQYEYSDWSGYESFWINTTEESPAEFQVTSPPDEPDGIVHDMLPEFTWEAAIEPDPKDSVYYTLEIAIDENFTFKNTIDSIWHTSYELTDSLLDFGSHYWWRAKATDNTHRSVLSSNVLDFRTWLLGDANGDYKIDILDIIFLINYKYKHGSGPEPVFAGDINGDCDINIIDIVYLINYKYKGGPEPEVGCE